jgi:hypothetical protein
LTVLRDLNQHFSAPLGTWFATSFVFAGFCHRLQQGHFPSALGRKAYWRSSSMEMIAYFAAEKMAQARRIGILDAFKALTQAI